jgi:hypothetical protein
MEPLDLHGREVGEAVDEAGLFAKLLREGVGQVVRRVGRDEEDAAADLGELDGEGARRRRLADAALAADEDPAERLLVQDGLERGLQRVVVHVDERGVRHGWAR